MALPPSLPGAVVQWLQQNGACAAAFGDSPTTPKFFGIYAFRSASAPNPSTTATTAPPYARVIDIGSEDMFQSAGDANPSYIERGELQIDVFAASEASARSLGKLVSDTINDAPLLFSEGTLLEIRRSRAFSMPEPDAGAATSIVYHRVLLFTYVLQGSTS